jgi:hypothetical protein
MTGRPALDDVEGVGARNAPPGGGGVSTMAGMLETAAAKAAAPRRNATIDMNPPAAIPQPLSGLIR